MAVISPVGISMFHATVGERESGIVPQAGSAPPGRPTARTRTGLVQNRRVSHHFGAIGLWATIEVKTGSPFRAAPMRRCSAPGGAASTACSTATAGPGRRAPHWRAKLCEGKPHTVVARGRNPPAAFRTSRRCTTRPRGSGTAQPQCTGGKRRNPLAGGYTSGNRSNMRANPDHGKTQ
jgi:hypothetical protein